MAPQITPTAGRKDHLSGASAEEFAFQARSTRDFEFNLVMDESDASTLAQTKPDAMPVVAEPDVPPSTSRRDRYREAGKLGAGAMGEVSLCEDRRIGREVALKAVNKHVADPTLRSRFLREARIQARLEHPAIVPVYDIGHDENGDPYFTMKRIRGRTLRDVIDGLKNGAPDIDPHHYSRRRLLSAFATVCLTVHYAHTRGVLHRDLKPSNIMLGEYGEIYVLDWGVAREASEPEESSNPSLKEAPSQPDLTAAGDLVGTPGYIAPEHLHGEALDARSDVYSLGAMLFEILTYERLHARDADVAIISTMSGTDPRPSRRGPMRDIPPELDVICTRATALAAENRYPTARALHDAVDGFLEGDRDLERRREAAREHATKAEQVTDAVFRETSSEDETRLRSEAMSEVSRALAFDPSNVHARRVLVRLLTEPPRTVPEPVRRELERHHEVQQQRAALGGALLYAMFFFWAPFTMLFAGARRGGWYFGLLAIAFAAAAAILYRASRLPYAVTRESYVTIVVTSIALSLSSGLVGPLLLVPSLVLANAIGFLLRPEKNRRRAVLLLSLAAITVPQILEWIGLVPPSAVIEAGRVTLVPRVLDFTPGTHVALFFLTIGLIVAIAFFFSRFRESLAKAEERLYVHAWQLRQLLPDDRT
jgi:serine/threonine-protein kinase